MKIRYLTDNHAVAGQIQPGHVKALADEGFTTIINNRPDGEMWGQPKGKVFAFCNSGTRSANVWGLAQAGKMSADDIIHAGMQAGYSLHGLRSFLEQAG